MRRSSASKRRRDYSWKDNLDALRLHGMRPLPGRLPGVPERQTAFPENDPVRYGAPSPGQGRSPSRQETRRAAGARPRRPRRRRNLDVHDLRRLHACLPGRDRAYPARSSACARARSSWKANFPAELNTFFRNMETNSNPWGIGFAKRADWAEGLERQARFSTIPDAEYPFLGRMRRIIR